MPLSVDLHNIGRHSPGDKIVLSFVSLLLTRTHTQPQVTFGEGHAQARGEPSDGEDVVKTACSHQQRGDALLHAVTVLLQQQHGGNHHRWRHSAQHKATEWRRSSGYQFTVSCKGNHQPLNTCEEIERGDTEAEDVWHELQASNWREERLWSFMKDDLVMGVQRFTWFS